MLTVTETAGSKLKGDFTRNSIESAVRVTLVNGCGGSVFVLRVGETWCGVGLAVSSKAKKTAANNR